MTVCKKQDDRIADLERRVRELEARPVIAIGYPVPFTICPHTYQPFWTTVGTSGGGGTTVTKGLSGGSGGALGGLSGVYSV